MEILSTGEKIRRGRIENNLTLKQLGDGVISVSKLSFIENDKVIPEKRELEYISKKLSLSIDYLNMNIQEQVNDQIKNSQTLTIEDIKKLIDICVKNNILCFSFDLYRILIEKYTDEKLLEEANNVFPHYWEALRRSEKSEDSIKFAISSIDYLMLFKEFQSVNAIISSLNLYAGFTNENFPNEKARVLIAEVKMQVLSPQFKMVEEYAKDIRELLKHKDKLKEEYKVELDILLCILSTIDPKVKYQCSLEESILKLKAKNVKISDYYIILGEVYYKLGKVNEYLDCLNKSESFIKCSNCSIYLNAVKDIITSLLDRKIYEDLAYFNNKYLDCALEQKEEDHTQFAYYIKALIGKKDSDLNNVETYLNVSLNILEKNSTAQDLKFRYQDLGELYYKRGNYKDAIKAFSKAHDLKNKF